MRLWSFHPQYLDSSGLTGLWREALLAKAVLKGETDGYQHHPQLNRFKNHQKPIDAINHYLHVVFNEAKERDYNFDSTKLENYDNQSIPVPSGQLNFEHQLLLNKLKSREIEQWENISHLTQLRPHPLFYITKGKKATWEKRVIN